MRRKSPLLAEKIALAALILAASALVPAAASERGAYSMEILVDGKPLTEYAARGTIYVEALRDCEYSVRLKNHTNRRVAVALSVDGLNSIDAKTTTARKATKWILAPHQTLTLDGWQTSSSTARRFFFTTERESYGAWLGKTDNLGIISAAFFREVQPEPKPTPFTREGSRKRAPSAPGEAPRAQDEADAGLSDDLAATGIGREIDHRVRRVRFNAEKHPAAVLNIRYEYRDALVRLGVIPRYEDPFARRERARGFEDMEFAPDPYRGGE